MPVSYTIRYKLKILDKRFGSKKYAIYDVILNKLYIAPDDLYVRIYHLHKGYKTARKIVDEMNKEFRHNLRYTKEKKKLGESTTIVNPYEVE